LQKLWWRTNLETEKIIFKKVDSKIKFQENQRSFERPKFYNESLNSKQIDERKFWSCSQFLIKTEKNGGQFVNSLVVYWQLTWSK
jgi:hypothetical protein